MLICPVNVPHPGGCHTEKGNPKAVRLDLIEPGHFGGNGMGIRAPPANASSLPGLSHSYWMGSKEGVTWLPFHLGSRIVREESIVSWRGAESPFTFGADALNEKEVAHKWASGVKHDRKAKCFFLDLYDRYTHSECGLLWKCDPASPTETFWCEWSWFLTLFDEEHSGSSMLEIFGEMQQLSAFSSRFF